MPSSTAVRSASASNTSHNGGIRARGTHLLGPRLRARHPGHLVACGDQLRHQPPPDGSARAGEEHPHVATSLSRRSIQPSSSAVSTSETKLAGPSHDGSDSPMSIRWFSECKRVLHQREREHRHAPARAPDGHERHGSEREVEGGEVAPCSGRCGRVTGRSRHRRSPARATAAGRAATGRARRRSGGCA